MKLYYNSEKWRKHSMRVARRAKKRRLSKKKQLRKTRRVSLGMSKLDRRNLRISKYYKQIITAPSNLAFLDDPDSVAAFITKLEKAVEKGLSLWVEMKDVSKIDYLAISAMLSVLYRPKKENMKINGSNPKNSSARDMLDKSGFVYTLFSKNPEVGHRHNISADNQLFTLDACDLNVVQEIVNTVSKRVFGEEKKLNGLYTTLGELMDNTTTHASGTEKKVETWWLSINYNDVSKKVSFVFMDYGVGIFTSLLSKKGYHPAKGLLDKAKAVFGEDATEKHLKSIVTEGARETYNLKRGRGEGMHGIYKIMLRGEIKNLHIISNNAFGNVSMDEYKKMKNELNGTLYSWEICAK